MIPFSPPRIDDKIINEVNDALRSGWITTGPRTKKLEAMLEEYTNCKKSLCVSSGSAGLELILRWYGVKQGDEVIVPAYTYAATANVVRHLGATVVFADNKNDFNISVESIKEKISDKTKVIIPVDIAGYPCDYDEINKLVEENRNLFKAENDNQEKLGRVLVLSDAAHSIGAKYNSEKAGNLTDITVFSFHAVKNLTTAEGGAVCLKLNDSFDTDEVYKELNIKILHGQTKDALAKTKIGSWRYDIVEAGYKYNMTDIQAAMGIVELERYEDDMLKRRKQIFEKYSELFSDCEWAETPIFKTDKKESSYHVYLLSLKDFREEERDCVIQHIFEKEVAVNVHYVPLPMMTYYKSLNYNIKDYPNSFKMYQSEITLPVYYDLSDTDVETVVNAVKTAVKKVK